METCPYCHQPLSRCRCKKRTSLVFALATLLAGCGSPGGGGEGVNSPTAVLSSGSDNETAIISETRRFATTLGVKVEGELTEYKYHVGEYLAAGWYVGSYTSGKDKGKGTAYYYRPYVLNMGRIVDGMYWETVTNVAGHETCHSESGAPHDHKHWECMARVASPTYPDPGTGVASQAGIGPGVSCGGGSGVDAETWRWR